VTLAALAVVTALFLFAFNQGFQRTGYAVAEAVGFTDANETPVFAEAPAADASSNFSESEAAAVPSPSPTPTPTPTATPADALMNSSEAEATPSPLPSPTPTPALAPASAPNTTKRVAMDVRASQGRTLNFQARVLNDSGEQVTAASGTQPGLDVEENRTYDVEVVPETRAVKKIRFSGVNLSKGFSLRLEDLDQALVEADSGLKAGQAYAIDPASLEFASAEVTVVARGDSLVKCAAWDFEGQRCTGTWAFLMDLQPGLEYTLNLSRDDPAFAEINVTFAAAANVTVAYRSNTLSGLNFPKIRVWNSSGVGSWGPEVELPTAGSPVREAIIKFSSYSPKRIVVTQSDDGLLDAYVSEDGVTWNVSSNVGRVWTTAPGTHSRRFDIAFESSTDDVVLAYAVENTSTTCDLAFKVLPENAVSFAGIQEQCLDDAGHATDIQYTWVDLARNPLNTSESMVLVGFELTDSDVNAWAWSGSAFTNPIAISNAATATSGYKAIAAEYAADGSKGMVLGADGAVGAVNWSYWSGSTWVAGTATDVDAGDNNDVSWITLKADPSSDDLQAVFLDSGQDLHTDYWNGATWTITANIDAGVDVSTSRPVDFAWSKTGSVGQLVWDTDGAGGTTLSNRSCSPQCTGATTTFSTYAGTGAWLTLYTNPTPSAAVSILGIRLNNAFDIGSFRFNNTGYTNYGDAAMTADTVVATYEAHSAAFQIAIDNQTPKWLVQSQEKDYAAPGASNNLSVYWTDNFRLKQAVLATNETGVWQNKTAYGSPMDLSGWAAWSNFTWQNSSTLAGTTVCWRVYAVDKFNNWNVTPDKCFEVILKLTANSSFTGPTTINTAQSTTLRGNCTCFPSGAACSNVNIKIQDNRTGVFTDSSTSPAAAVYANATGYSIGSLSGASADYSFLVRANTLGQYQFRVQCNSTDAMPATENSTASILNVVVTYGWLNATLVSPTGTNSQPQNQVFSLNASVACVGNAGDTCGSVNGTARYNATTANPDTALQGNNVYATPFYAVQANPLACGVMNSSSPACNVAWTVNATGSVGSGYKLDVNVTSNATSVASNKTDYTTINIIAPALSITISDALADVKFGSALVPGTTDNPALNNSDNAYNITCEYQGGSCNVSIKANANMLSGANVLAAGNVSWNQVNSPAAKKPLTLSYNVINATLPHLGTQPLYFWIDVPAGQPFGTYASNFTILGQPN
jgi:hypothetical protein